MTWPPLDEATHLWLAHSVAAPAMEVTADELAAVPGAGGVSDRLGLAARLLAQASSSETARCLAREAGREITVSARTANLAAPDRQLVRLAVGLLAAAAHRPGDELHLEADHEAWVWAARTTQRAEREASTVDRIAVALIAGTALPALDLDRDCARS